MQRTINLIDLKSACETSQLFRVEPLSAGWTKNHFLELRTWQSFGSLKTMTRSVAKIGSDDYNSASLHNLMRVAQAVDEEI